MNKQMRDAVEYCAQHGHAQAVFVAPFQVRPEEARWLREQSCCAAMILRNPDPEITTTSSATWLGCYSGDGASWMMPTNGGHFVFVGPPLMITASMVEQVRNAGQHSITVMTREGFAEVSLYRFALWDLSDRLVQKLRTLPEEHLLVRTVRAARRVPILRSLWHRLLRRKSSESSSWQGTSVPAAGSAGEGADDKISFVIHDVDTYRVLLSRALEAARADRSPVPGRILLVNAGLAAGGAERQVVNTLVGLKARGYEDASLLGEYLHSAPGLDFYLSQLKRAGISASQVERRISLAEHGLESVAPAVADALSLLPTHLIAEILNLTEEFRARRPEVVHAWQDSTSIKCGIAAVIAGVPKIVLSSRNVNPTNFAYHQSYMKPAYLALSELNHVALLSNSEAGAEDYSRWLGLSRERFTVVRNGVDFAGLNRESTAAQALRKDLGISDRAPVVGSIFRFWPEKRPLLWLQVAEHVARNVPAAHFLIIGEGPMRGEMEDHIRRGGLRGRVHLPGAQSDISVPLSAMDLFLLTSAFEGTPNVVLEAQWLGIPVVATDSGGTREAVNEGVTGWIAGVPDPVLIASRVVVGLRDDEWRRGAICGGPAFVTERFGLGRMVRETVEVYGYPKFNFEITATGLSEKLA